MNLTDISDLREHYRRGEGGRHWFDASTMRFFRSRLPQTAYTTEDGTVSFFVTSEQYDWNAPRLYTVRQYNWQTREIDTVGAFQAYRSRSGANQAACRMARDASRLPNTVGSHLDPAAQPEVTK